MRVGWCYSHVYLPVQSHEAIYHDLMALAKQGHPAIRTRWDRERVATADSIAGILSAFGWTAPFVEEGNILDPEFFFSAVNEHDLDVMQHVFQHIPDWANPSGMIFFLGTQEDRGRYTAWHIKNGKIVAETGSIVKDAEGAVS